MMSKTVCFFKKKSAFSKPRFQNFVNMSWSESLRNCTTLANQLEKVECHLDLIWTVVKSGLLPSQMVNKSNENGNKSMYILLMDKIPTGKLVNSWYIYNINWCLVSIKHMHNLGSSYSALSSQIISPYKCRYILYIYSPLYTTRFSHSVTYYTYIYIYIYIYILYIYIHIHCIQTNLYPLYFSTRQTLKWMLEKKRDSTENPNQLLPQLVRPEKNTPWKIKMEPKKGGFGADDFPFQLGDFSVPCWFRFWKVLQYSSASWWFFWGMLVISYRNKHVSSKVDRNKKRSPHYPWMSMVSKYRYGWFAWIIKSYTCHISPSNSTAPWPHLLKSRVRSP